MSLTENGGADFERLAGAGLGGTPPADHDGLHVDYRNPADHLRQATLTGTERTDRRRLRSSTRGSGGRPPGESASGPLGTRNRSALLESYPPVYDPSGASQAALLGARTDAGPALAM